MEQVLHERAVAYGDIGLRLKEIYGPHLLQATNNPQLAVLLFDLLYGMYRGTLAQIEAQAETHARLCALEGPVDIRPQESNHAK